MIGMIAVGDVGVIFRVGVGTGMIGSAGEIVTTVMIAVETGGSIVNIASIAGFSVDKGIAAYATSKAGVIQLTKALALEWARYGIRVNAIAPGWFATEINTDYLASPAGQAILKSNPMRRFGKDGDLDGALLLLSSGAGGYITGTTLTVDGGHLLTTGS